MLENQRHLRNDLRLLLAIVAILTTVGLLFIYSSSSVYALEKFGSSNYFVIKQFIGLLVGIFCFFVAQAVPAPIIKKYTPLFFLVALALTLATLVPGLGVRIHGSRRWLALPGVTFQPSELLKVAFILYFAQLMVKKKHVFSSFWKSFVPFLIVLGVVALTLLKQPDFGLTVTISLTAFIMLFVANANNVHLMLTLASAVPVVIALICLQPYRLKRFMTFLNPWADPQGAGFQIIQSLIAVGSGNIFGLGITHSKQKFFYLPMQHTDFIFSIIAEETGFIGSCLVIFLYISFAYIGLRMLRNLTDSFTIYTVVGFVSMVNIQALINLAVAIGLVPTKGIGLPFVSYGNTSLVATLGMLGIVSSLILNSEA